MKSVGFLKFNEFCAILGPGIGRAGMVTRSQNFKRAYRRPQNDPAGALPATILEGHQRCSQHVYPSHSMPKRPVVLLFKVGFNG
jgi:hypothetical protein